MEHRAYPKIPARHDGAPAPGGTWVATEKVHGAQLVIATDGQTTRIGKRKAWLNPGDSFFGWQLLRADLEAAAQALFAAVGKPKIVRLYGELFGGGYPHSSVPAMPGASLVQTGISYAPDIRFALFDILVETKQTSDGEFLSHSEVVSLGRAARVVVVPLLGRGPRATLEQLPIRFPSRVPHLLGLPPLEDNVAEGFVLKPDARASVSERYVVKRKIPEFDGARFDESSAWNSEVSLDLEALKRLGARLVNDARFASARSKVGDDASAVREELVLDVLVDLEAAFPAAFQALSQENEAALRAHVVSVADRWAEGSRG